MIIEWLNKTFHKLMWMLATQITNSKLDLTICIHIKNILN